MTAYNNKKVFMPSESAKEVNFAYQSIKREPVGQMIFYYIQTMRPQHWSKNFLIFAGLLFSKNLLQVTLLLQTLTGLFAFCMISSSVYIINDLADLEKDRSHPLKCQRPIAAGLVSLKHALIIAIFLAFTAFMISYVVEPQFFTLVVLYFVIMLGYSFYFKKILILDIILIASVYIIRTISGAIIVDVTISPWLIFCTFFLSLFLISCKRRHELIILGKNSVVHRQILVSYSPQLLDQLIKLTTASTIICYALYTFSSHTVSAFGFSDLIYTVPIVIFGLFRYLFLVYNNNRGGNPEILMWTDKPLLISILVWVIVLVILIYG